MKKIIYIELCNFSDYPLGGHLSFALHLTTAMQGDIDIAGYQTDNSLSECKWHEVEINGNKYNFYNVKNIKRRYSKPIIPMRIKDYVRIKKHINEILSGKEYDIIIVQTPEVLFSIPNKFLNKVCLICPGVNNPVAISRFKMLRRFAGFYDKLFFNKAKDVKIILPAADSKAIKAFIKRSNSKLDESKIVQFPTRYDASIFKPKEKEDCRNRLNIPQDVKVIVTTGRLNWVKGWKLLIDSFTIFLSTHRDALLYFVGRGEDEQIIKNYIESKKLTSKVILAGVHPLNTVSDYINASDIFVMGSYTEGWSTSLVEAIACGKPCIVTDFSSASDLVQNGINGFIQNTRDENEFAKNMEKALILDPIGISKISQDAYSMSVQCMRSQLNEILHFE